MDKLQTLVRWPWNLEHHDGTSRGNNTSPPIRIAGVDAFRHVREGIRHQRIWSLFTMMYKMLGFTAIIARH